MNFVFYLYFHFIFIVCYFDTKKKAMPTVRNHQENTMPKQSCNRQQTSSENNSALIQYTHTHYVLELAYTCIHIIDVYILWKKRKTNVCFCYFTKCVIPYGSSDQCLVSSLGVLYVCLCVSILKSSLLFCICFCLAIR